MTAFIAGTDDSGGGSGGESYWRRGCAPGSALRTDLAALTFSMVAGWSAGICRPARWFNHSLAVLQVEATMASRAVSQPQTLGSSNNRMLPASLEPLVTKAALSLLMALQVLLRSLSQQAG